MNEEWVNLTDKYLANCSFCGRVLLKSTQVVQGPGVQICKQCVIACCKILHIWPNGDEMTGVCETCQEKSINELDRIKNGNVKVEIDGVKYKLVKD